MLQQLRIVFTLGIEGIPLACVGADGYMKRLLFWSCAPFAAAILTVLGVAVHGAGKRTANSLQTVVKRATPIILRLAFLIYPCAQVESNRFPPPCCFCEAHAHVPRAAPLCTAS